MPRIQVPGFLAAAATAAALSGCGGGAPDAQPTPAGPPPVVGRWDATVQGDSGPYPSWFEIEVGADGALEGRFVGREGSARPLGSASFADGALRFSLPPQYEEREDDLSFTGRLVGDDRIEGETTDDEGRTLEFSAVRAPELLHDAPDWGEPIDLFAAGRDGWRLREPGGDDGWSVADGVLVNAPPSVDLVTERRFGDFKLSIEFLMPEKSNSGIYLRGRYEVQVQDDHGKEPGSRLCGGVYGFLTPPVMACHAAGEWNTAEITLVGRRLWLVLNGESLFDGAEIPGITGGALDSAEGEPGPLMLQGDHEAIRYRNAVLTPAAGSAPEGAEGS